MIVISLKKSQDIFFKALPVSMSVVNKAKLENPYDFEYLFAVQKFDL